MHIPIKQLRDLAADEVSSSAADNIHKHLAECSECASQFARIKSEAGRDPDGRVLAVLSFDSRQLSSAFGVRSGGSVARQLLFSIGENDLDLRVAPDDGAWVVSGQVLGECGCGEVELRGENISERAPMNELCEFYLPRVPPGSYSLLVYISNIEIEVPEFELRA